MEIVDRDYVFTSSTFLRYNLSFDVLVILRLPIVFRLFSNHLARIESHSLITSIALSFACHSSCIRSILRATPSAYACFSAILLSISPLVLGLGADRKSTRLNSSHVAI